MIPSDLVLDKFGQRNQAFSGERNYNTLTAPPIGKS